MSDARDGDRDRPTSRDPRPLFRDEKVPASPENPTVLLPAAPPPRQAPPAQSAAPPLDATAVLPVQPEVRADRPFPPVQRQGGYPPPVAPSPARPTPAVPEGWFVDDHPAPAVSAAGPTVVSPSAAHASARPGPPAAVPPAPASPTPPGPPASVPPVPGRAGPPPPKRRGRWRRRLFIALALIVILPTALYFFADSRVGRVDAFPSARTRPAATPGADWLIVGSDSREGLSKAERKKLATGKAIGKRTDTMMLLHIPESGKPTLVSLPRDSYVPIAGHGSNRLNAAFAFGGAPLLIQTVEDATDIRIDHYAEIGFSGVFDVVNALGGIDMCIKSAMKDPKAGLNIPKGCQTLDGAEALGFSRTRASTRGDLDRVGHQRELMTAIMKKVASPSTIVNPFKLWPLLMKGTGSLTIDGGDHLLDLARLAFAAKALGSGGVTTTVPIGGTPTINGAEVLTWDKARAETLFGALRADRKVPKSVLSG